MGRKVNGMLFCMTGKRALSVLGRSFALWMRTLSRAKTKPILGRGMGAKGRWVAAGCVASHAVNDAPRSTERRGCRCVVGGGSCHACGAGWRDGGVGPWYGGGAYCGGPCLVVDSNVCGGGNIETRAGPVGGCRVGGSQGGGGILDPRGNCTRGCVFDIADVVKV